MVSATLPNSLPFNVLSPVALTMRIRTKKVGRLLSRFALSNAVDMSFGFSISNGAGSFAFNVPNNPALLKAKVYLQSMAGSKTTNGVEIVVGDR